MSHLAGFVFDIYDDPNGEVLREVIPQSGDIPDFVKSAALIRDDVSEDLTDDSYALVLVKNGHKFRKYATVDKGNTVLSVLYLLKQAHLMPPRAVKVAATNLIEACDRYDLEVPDQLKLASEQYLEGRENPQLGEGDGTDDDTKARTNVKGVDGTNPLEVPMFSQKEKEIENPGAGVDKTGFAKEAAADPQTLSLFDHGDEAEVKRKNWRVDPYVDVQDWEPTYEKTASAPERTLLRGKFPVDSYDQVKTAAAYFSAGSRRISPRDRREYCIKLAARMRELSITVPEDIEKYASPGYGADVDAYVSYRRNFVAEEFLPALDTLLEKRAQVSPDTFAEALSEFDYMTNLNYMWDSQIPDPWASTFGPSIEKVAADEWVWDHNGVHVDEADLENLVRNGLKLVTDKFGEDFAKQFAKNPKTFFNALPLPNRLVVGRLAMDRHPGTVTE